jgi:electron-transferring-flavoprotein dehydrogenase
VTESRETLEVDVLFVGGGPAGLAGALRLTQLIDAHNKSAQASGAPPLGEVSIALLEKASEIGAHGISGCVLDPRALSELLPDYRAKGAPIEADVASDDLYYFTKSGQVRFPFLPPPLQNHGNHVVSLGDLERWLGGLVEAAGAYVLPNMAAVEGLFEGDRMVGVRTGDKGIDRQGNQKANFEPGSDVRAKVTILCEGVRGSLAKRLTPRLKLDEDRAPQIYATGIKEVWQMPAGRVPKGRVIHTMGAPLDSHTFGGGFIYGMDKDRWAVGFVVGLDYQDPTTDPHGLFQAFKRHPFVAALLEGGTIHSYGAKAIPEGGYYSMPRLSWAGGLLCGDSAAFLNSQRLKGVHLAMKSGMLAAETLCPALSATPDRVKLPTPGSVVICTALNALAGLSLKSVNPKSTPAKVYCVSSEVVIVLSLPAGASLTEVTSTLIVLGEASRSTPALAVPPSSCTWKVKLV